MDRYLKRLLGLYPIARNWTVLSNYITPFQSVHSISRIYSTSFTDYTQFGDNTSTTRMNNAPNIKVPCKSMKLLEEAATNYTNMTVHDVVDTMSTLFKESQNMKDIQDIGKHIGFIRLCEVLNKDIRLIKTTDIIQILKIFTYFKIPSNNILTQSLLQMIRTTANEISIRNIIFISFLLKKMDRSLLRDSLMIALPVVFEVQLPTKLDSDDIVMLSWSLRFVAENKIKNSIIQDLILNLLLKHENNRIDVRTARSIFYSLCDMCDMCDMSYCLPSIVFEVLSKVQMILIDNAKQLNVREITKMLEKLVFVSTKNTTYGYKFYNEALVDACVSSALSSNINFTSGIHLLKLLNDLNYAHIPFLEYLAAKCFEEPNLLIDASYFKVSAFLEGFINADYKPVFWDTIRDAILANKVENKSFSNSMIRFTLHLTALDCYSPNLLKKVFSGNIKANETKKNIYARELLLLYQSVKTLYPTYNGPWPSQNILEYAIVNVGPPRSTCSIRVALELALGGPQYIHNNLRTRLGHYIDHVVVMRKGGYPVAINNTVTSSGTNTIYIEDMQIPSESQIILIFNLPDIAYAVNSQRLKSTWLLQIKSAEALTNSNTIAINSRSWMKLAEHERVPYLMQAVRLKCEDFSISAN